MKATIATVKSFINKNRNRLLIKVNSGFDGMTDCVQTNIGATYRPVKFNDREASDPHTCGIYGVWFVGHSRDHVQAFTNQELTGFMVSNSCGSWEIATRN